MDSLSPDTQAPRPRPARAGARLPFAERKRRARERAGQRVAARTTVDLTPAQRAHDPLARGHLSRGGRVVRAVAAVVGAAALHIGVLALGLTGIGKRDNGRREVAIEMREYVPPPPLPPPPEPPPEPEPPKVERPVQRRAPEPPPPEPQKAPPPRVVGLSMESTTEGGGGGPGFAVGNTREGKTAETAVAPKAVPAVPGPEAPAVNQAASRIPTAGVKYTLPRCPRTSKPDYPETLKLQGIEADVPVLVALDAAGNPTSVRVLKPAPYPEFDEAARKYVMGEVCEPATRDGVPIPYSLSFTVRFRLQDE